MHMLLGTTPSAVGSGYSAFYFIIHSQGGTKVQNETGHEFFCLQLKSYVKQVWSCSFIGR